MKKIRKRGLLFCVICLIGVLTAGCGNKLSDKFDEDEVKKAAENMIDQVNAGELEDIYENTFALSCGRRSLMNSSRKIWIMFLTSWESLNPLRR